MNNNILYVIVSLYQEESTPSATTLVTANLSAKKPPRFHFLFVKTFYYFNDYDNLKQDTFTRVMGGSGKNEQLILFYKITLS